MIYDFRITGTDEKSIAAYSGLLSLVFPETKKYTPAFLDWQYNLNPAGKVVGFDAFYGNELAAHYVTIPVMYSFKGQTIKGLLSLNTATHPGHQGKGLFTQLASRTYEHAAGLGYRFVIGVANQNSTHGFLKKLGFALVAPLGVRLFLGKVPLSEPSDGSFSALWNDELAKWRLSNPSATYFKNGNSVSSATHISMIDAILSQRGVFANARLSKKHAPVKMTIGHNLGRSGLFRIGLPDRFKPSPLNLIFKKLGDLPEEVGSSTIYFECIDFDAY